MATTPPSVGELVKKVTRGNIDQLEALCQQNVGQAAHEIMQSASGWGALEIRRRKKNGLIAVGSEDAFDQEAFEAVLGGCTPR